MVFFLLLLGFILLDVAHFIGKVKILVQMCVVVVVVEIARAQNGSNSAGLLSILMGGGSG